MRWVRLQTADGATIDVDPSKVTEIREVNGIAQIEQVTIDPLRPLRIAVADKPSHVAKLLNAAL